MATDDRRKQIIRTSFIGIAANAVLAGFKLAVGLLTNSIAIVLDAVNNVSDALSSVITVLGTKIAGKPADKKHPFGHGRYEYLSAAVISAIVLYAGVHSLSESVQKVIHPVEPEYTAASLIIVGAAVAAKLLLGHFVKRRGEKLNSDSLINSGKDALLDSVISASTLVAAAVFLIFRVSLEAWLGIVISLFIIKSGIDMFRKTISKILGERIESELSKSVKETICETEGVIGAYDLILNSYGPERWLGSVHIEIPDSWTADRIDTVSREITHNVALKDHVILTAIGIYSQNSSDDEAMELRTRITEAIMAQEYVLQVHGFYCDVVNRSIRFDIVIDFMAPSVQEVYDAVLSRVRELCPGYTITIQPDSDYSD